MPSCFMSPTESLLIIFKLLMVDPSLPGNKWITPFVIWQEESIGIKFIGFSNVNIQFETLPIFIVLILEESMPFLNLPV